MVVLPKPACGFRYRSSIFNIAEYFGASSSTVEPGPLHHPARELPAEARRRTEPEVCRLTKALRGGQDTAFSGRGARGGARDSASKGMLIVPGDEESAAARDRSSRIRCSARQQFQELGARAQAKGLTFPAIRRLKPSTRFPRRGWWSTRGLRKGSGSAPPPSPSKHALALINAGDAGASDILRLKEAIQRGVQSEWGLRWTQSR